MEDEKSSNLLKNYYVEKKIIIELIGFWGVIAGLFLEITQYNTEPLKKVQAFLLLIFAISLSYLLINFCAYFKRHRERRRSNLALNGLVLTLVISAFIINLFEFIVDSFWGQILSIIESIKFWIWIFIIFYFEDDIEDIVIKHFKRYEAWIILKNVTFISLGMLVFFSSYMKKNIYDPNLYIVIVFFALISSLQDYKIISGKVFFFILILIIVAAFSINYFCYGQWFSPDIL